ncbi:protein lin-37 homolog [Artemia franciscana]|uniref:Uncharacterized protein n=1 Tax=Artemia franciscana TaxID=6661 RepID=A0AA88HTC4_ARTSF|nr:hypothetical protein QYM36_006412 [Artemia franciscana]
MIRANQLKEINRARSHENMLNDEPPVIFDEEFEEQFKRATSDRKLKKIKDGSKYYKHHQVKEINRARGHFQNLLERSDSSGSDDDMLNDEPPEIFDQDFEEQFKRETSDWKLIKDIPKQSTKKKEQATDYEFNDHRSYVLKLYDRSVDLGLFSPESPLYSVCRAWIKNDPNNLDIKGKPQSPTPVHELENLFACDEDQLAMGHRPVYFLPPPDRPPLDRRGMPVDSRIPIPAKPNREAIEACISQPEPIMKGQELLRNHLVHWWNVRQKWNAGCRQREKRYERSLNILRRMYERSAASQGTD